MQIMLRPAEWLVGLNEYAIGSIVEIEVVHVLRSHEYAQSAGDLRKRDPHRLGFFAIDGHEFLRIVGGKRREQIRKLLFAAAGRNHLVSDAVKIAESIASSVLELKLESAVTAHTLHSWRLNQSNQSAVGHEHQALQLRRKISNDFRGRMALATALIRRPQPYVHQALIGRRTALAESNEFEHSGDVGILRHYGRPSVCEGA